MIRAKRNDIEISVELAGIHATVEPNLSAVDQQNLQPWSHSIENGIEAHLKGEYFPDRQQAAADYLESEGFEIIEVIKEDTTELPETTIF